MSAVHRALPPHAAFVPTLLAYTNGDDWEGWEARPRVGDIVEVYDRDLDRVPIVDVVDGHPVVLAPGGERVQLTEHDMLDIRESPYAESLWEAAQKAGQPDGVAWGDALVSDPLRQRLRVGFDGLCAELEPDYHPGSGDTVRDLLHPSLYHFVDGVTPLGPGVAPSPATTLPTVDRWGRPYEASAHQWLPAEVDVDSQGRARFASPLHDHDPGPVGDLKPDLEALLTAALPLFESTLGYAELFEPWDHRHDDCEADLPEPSGGAPSTDPVAPVSLRGRRLQIIPKLVQYELSGDDTYDSVWHVEGMSHEHLVATAVFVLDRDPNLQGGTLRFRRGYTRDEAGRTFWTINQCRPRTVDEMVDRKVLPIGSLDTPAGRLLCFPNSHIHKLTPMSSADGQPCTRRVVVFWLVDPAVRIRSTADVPPQRGRIPHDQALQQRLDLMDERRRHKQSHNLREISLCEH